MNRIYKTRWLNRTVFPLFLLLIGIVYIDNFVINTNDEILTKVFYACAYIFLVWISLFGAFAEYEITPDKLKFHTLSILPFSKTITAKREHYWKEISEIRYSWSSGLQIITLVVSDKSKMNNYFALRSLFENPRELVRTIINNCPNAKIDDELIRILGKKDHFAKWFNITIDGLSIGTAMFFILFFILPLPNDEINKAIYIWATLLGSWLFMFILFYFLENKNDHYYE